MKLLLTSLISGLLLLRTSVATGTNLRRKLAEEDENPHGFRLQMIEGDEIPACEEMAERDIDFTLVTQLSTIRLWVMEEQCKRWGRHKLSVAIGSNEGDYQSIVMALTAMGCDPELTTVTVIYDLDESAFPVNTLRNLAFEGVKTSHAVYVDADFMVSPNLYEHLMDHRALLTNPKNAYLLPAFELRRICDAGDPDCKRMHLSIMPENKQELVDMFGFPQENQTVTPAIIPFDMKVNAGGHNTTRYEDWLVQDRSELIPIECIASPERFEPYLTVRMCADLPPFQEAFTGYGKNKVTWFQQLRRMGFRVYQLADSFALHFPHKKSQSFKTWDKTRRKVGRDGLEVDKIFEKYERWLQVNVEDETVIPDCEGVWHDPAKEEVDVGVVGAKKQPVNSNNSNSNSHSHHVDMKAEGIKKVFINKDGHKVYVKEDGSKFYITESGERVSL